MGFLQFSVRFALHKGWRCLLLVCIPPSILHSMQIHSLNLNACPLHCKWWPNHRNKFKTDNTIDNSNSGVVSAVAVVVVRIFAAHDADNNSASDDDDWWYWTTLKQTSVDIDMWGIRFQPLHVHFNIWLTQEFAGVDRSTVGF